MTSTDRCTFLTISGVVLGIVTLGTVLAIAVQAEDWAPRQAHRVIPAAAQEAAAEYTLSLKMASTPMSSAVNYAQDIFGVCCSCDAEESHTVPETPYIDQATREIIEEEAAVDAVASMFSDEELDHTTYIGIASLPEAETDTKIAVEAANPLNILATALCSSPCCTD